MKDIGIRDALFDRFLQLNSFSGISFISANNSNVSMPNKAFSIPEDKKWFELYFKPSEPEDIGMFNNGSERYSGFLQIDICTTKDLGEKEADNRFKWISKLFSVGSCYGDACINKVCKVDTQEEDNCYRTIIRVYFDADVNNE